MQETDLDKKVRNACHRIEELYYETEGKCYVSFSGGKDSTTLLALIKLCEEVYTIPPNSIPAVFSNTGIELGVTVSFVSWVKENWYTNVQIIRPEKSFDWILKNTGKPALSKLKSEELHRWQNQNRTQNLYRSLVIGKTLKGKNASKTKIADKYMHMLSDEFSISISQKCCDYLKKKPFRKYTKYGDYKGQIIGIRMNEGGVRESVVQKRLLNGGKLCTYYQHGMIMKAPVIDWTDEDMEKFIEKYGVPLSDAYTKYGFRRTGCMCCPYSQNLINDLKYLYYHEHNRYIASMHWLKDVYIAQNVKLPFDESYERERERMWQEVYEPMRQEMLRKYRPNSRLIKDEEQLSLFCEDDIKKS